jgi:hypothetical protein
MKQHNDRVRDIKQLVFVAVWYLFAGSSPN